MAKATLFIVFAFSVLVSGCATARVDTSPVLNGWGATVTPAEPSGWKTRVIPATLWRPGWQWC